MTELLIVFAVGFLPMALLAGGLLSLGMAMPSARPTLARWRWITPVTVGLILTAVAVLAWMVATVDDYYRPQEIRNWDRMDVATQRTVVAALIISIAAVGVQTWVLTRRPARPCRWASVGMAVAGVAMLVLLVAGSAAFVSGSH